jgi:hypothetical protein
MGAARQFAPSLAWFFGLLLATLPRPGLRIGCRSSPTKASGDSGFLRARARQRNAAPILADLPALSAAVFAGVA